MPAQSQSNASCWRWWRLRRVSLAARREKRENSRQLGSHPGNPGLNDASGPFSPSLLRFDVAYFSLLKCNRNRFADYPNLSNYMRELYEVQRFVLRRNVLLFRRLLAEETNKGARRALQSLFHRVAAVGVALIAGLLLSSFTAEAQTAIPPDVVKLPSGIDLGFTSFYDGFGRTDPGWVFLNYFRWNDFTSIKDSNGQNSPLFVDPRIDVISTLFHAVYVPPIQAPNGAIAFEALLPIVDFQSHFNPPGMVLTNNGLNFGDTTFGVLYQSKPISLGAQSVLSWRVDIQVIAPTGGFDGSRDLNQSSGFWSVAPYVAVTLLPVPKWEISARFNYIYNLPTSLGSNPPQIPGFEFLNGQAGQAGWINFSSSYEVAEGIRPGLNGFWLQQFTDDRTNGISVPGTRVEELYLGPGLSWVIDKKNTSNFNLYLPISAKDTPAGPQFNIQFIHQF
jgi:hypothetical protein